MPRFSHKQDHTIKVEQVERLLGVSISQEKILGILTGLGFTPLNENSPWHFRVPSFRLIGNKKLT